MQISMSMAPSHEAPRSPTRRRPSCTRIILRWASARPLPPQTVSRRQSQTPGALPQTLASRPTLGRPVPRSIWKRASAPPRTSSLVRRAPLARSRTHAGAGRACATRLRRARTSPLRTCVLPPQHRCRTLEARSRRRGSSGSRRRMEESALLVKAWSVSIMVRERMRPARLGRPLPRRHTLPTSEVDAGAYRVPAMANDSWFSDLCCSISHEA